MSEMQKLLSQSVAGLRELLPKVAVMHAELLRLGEMMMGSWQGRGKVLLAGNGGSAADAMHLAEELSIRYKKKRRGLAAIALCDPTVLTCAANDFGYERVFARQVEALGNPGDVLIVFSTSGNSPSIVAALDAAQAAGLRTAAFLGQTGGQCKGKADIEFCIPSPLTASIQECHKILFHALCEWIDTQVD
ncbi:MAG TPA: SIS domain-containing protein [Tepidisphaeraceae bacterium]|jgi:D-sedoheptulose 7-phosphate isomerase